MRSKSPNSGIPFARGVARLALVGTCVVGGCFSPGADITGSSSSGGTTSTATGTTMMVTGTTTGQTSSVPTTGPTSTSTSTSTGTTMAALTTGSTGETTTGTMGSTTTGDSSGSTTEAGTTVQLGICGDDIVDPGEQCDDGNVVPGDGCSAFCMVEDDYRVVFVSSQLYSGKNMMGEDVGDSNCNVLVMGIPAMAGRTFVAWLSSGESNVKDRIGISLLPYRLVDGKTTVASNTADLLDGTLDAPIDHNELGAKVGAPLPVLTGTTTAGVATGEDCSGWSAAGTATTGLLTNKDATWTTGDTADCTALRRIYCIEKAK